MRTLITAGTIVTLNPRRDIIHDATIVVDDGLITGILPSTSLHTSSQSEGEVVDATRFVAIPGFVQTHIHLCQTLFRGLADDLELLDWLRMKIFPFEAAHNADSMRASAFLGIAELFRCGTTTIMDMGSIHHEEEIIRTIHESGMRAFVGKAMMDVNDHYEGLKETTMDSLETSRGLAEQYHGYDNGRIRYAFAPRFVLSCTEELLRSTNDMLQSFEGALLHTHAAENRSEMDAVRNRCKMGNVEYFHHINILHDRTCLAHCIWLNPSEVGLMKERDAKVLHCPSSNLKLGSGIANVPEYLSKGISVSLGADGAPCNNNLNMFTEMRLAALIQKPVHGPTSMSARTVLEMATLGGAKTLGLQNEIGSIEAGKKADIVLIDLEKSWNPAGADDVYSSIVYSSDPRNVHSVMVDGRWVMRGYGLSTIDEETLQRTSKTELNRLLQRTQL
jgi:5-methylthioadenosine/S-adenosylhomocysteine deaminase